ncbi:hypothetical protein CFOL_v3_08090 [Cephalotus follicularis]|uniref:Uncharacterized protein n=1 Tax=Cephalotus follicularis TaxID=3775 RepID=A0A1Q3B9S8_CEPFO|nr:hypothetical protein CFOL_v3_08090 [Cephalotus follicularis]
MASVQVLPISRKQEHLQAGKRRLEEFRKKKAAERAKKATSSNQPDASDVSLLERHRLETESVRVIDSDGGVTSNGPDGSVIQSHGAIDNDDNTAVGSIQRRDHVSSNEKHANYAFSTNGYNSFSTDLVQTDASDQETNNFDDSEPSVPVNFSNRQDTKDRNNDFGVYTGVQGKLPYANMSDHFISRHSHASQDGSFSQSILYGMEESQLKENDSFRMVSTVISPGASLVSVTNSSPQDFGSTLLQSKPSNTSSLVSGRRFSWEDSTLPTTTGGSSVEVASINSDLGERNLSTSVRGLSSVDSAPVQASVSLGFNSNVTSVSDHVPLHSAQNETNSRRSRPSFLDSLNVTRPSSGATAQHTESEKLQTSQVDSMDVFGSSAFPRPLIETESVGPFSKLRTPNGTNPFGHFVNSSVSASYEGDLLRPSINKNIEMKHEFYSPKQNEDFGALEQHIEDLTQEKFSLQRALEASRSLAESLAAENSSLTDSYNQQRTVVNQLKSDMEKLQEEIKAQLAELDSFKNEYANARLECNAADERANILASEVIGLEEKALRLRSNELKLERQLENSQTEISSYKKKMSSLERERQDFQSTIDALQEEKKLLQSKLRKASTSGKSVDISPTSRKDMSTSTEDLENQDSQYISNQEMHHNASPVGSDASDLSLLAENGQLNFEVSSLNIPSDQMRIIQNINTLISELALEKEELMQALSSESSQTSKLKALNKEFSTKLEAQTQRLELLTAQTMATENNSARQPDLRMMQDNTAYADEGDEVVERVLGWIMKLFPGGPSRRRTKGM